MSFFILASICFTLDYKYNTFTKVKKFFLLPRYYIVNIINAPFEFFKEINNYVVLHKNLVKENIALKQFINLQATKLQTLTSLELENIRLKELLRFVNQEQHIFSLANIMATSTDLFKHQIIVNRGALHGAYVGQPIVNADGILGSLASVDERISTAILITDLSYAIPVVNQRNDLRAIALGSGNLDTLVLQHIPKTADIQEQDIFVTSGIGGKYPAGYMVGKVVKVQKEVNFPFAAVTIKVAANLDSCREVLLLYNSKESTKNK